MNIDELEAGRELDALVAEKVMGWTDMGDWYGKGPAGIAPGVQFCDLVPHYSTDIAAAWQVVENHPHYFSLHRTNDWRGGRYTIGDPMRWVCRFYAPQQFEVVADTAPLAICRAALKTVQETE